MASIIDMPKLSPTMEEGVLAKWTKKEGDKVAPGDMVAEVETDKANMDFPLEDEGVLLKLLVKEGDTVKLGEPVAVIGKAGEDPASALRTARREAGEPAAPPVAAPVRAKAAEAIRPQPRRRSAAAGEAATPPTPVAPQRRRRRRVDGGNGHGRVLASPFARKLALEKGVDLRGVTGTGPRGRIVQRDIDEAAARGPRRTAVAATARRTRRARTSCMPASQMRKTIARRLVEAKREIPHIYLTAECDGRSAASSCASSSTRSATSRSASTTSWSRRWRWRSARIPDANVSWTADGIVRHGGVHVGMAVSLPDNGLITPVVRDADRKSLGALARETRVARRAGARQEAQARGVLRRLGDGVEPRHVRHPRVRRHHQPARVGDPRRRRDREARGRRRERTDATASRSRGA